MAITRNDLLKEPTQGKATNKTVPTFAPNQRKMELGLAEKKYAETGDVKTFQQEASRIKEPTLGGSVEQYNIEGRQDTIANKEYGRTVGVAQEAYKANPNEATAAELKKALEAGYQKFVPASSKGTDITAAIRNLGGSETERTLADIAQNWKNDPENYKDQYKQSLQEGINFYGKDSAEAVTLRQKMRKVDEESILNKVRNAKLDYENDPQNSYGKYTDAQQELADFYGSSADGYYAKEALRKTTATEQERLDTDASYDFQTGQIGYDGYKSYLDASMSKYSEGSEEYMKYYKASSDLAFNHNLDEVLRQQYDSPPGQVLTNLKSMQGKYAPGSYDYQQVQNSIDTLDQQIRKESYNNMLKVEIQKRNESIASINAKLYVLQQDYASGGVGDSEFKKKYKNYSDKLSYLKDSNTLPTYQSWNSYSQYATPELGGTFKLPKKK